MAVAQLVFSIYAWIAIGVLVAFLWRIAYFYQKASDEPLRHRLLAVPVVLLGAGALWYIVRGGEFVGHPASDTLLFVGGLLLILFSARLQELMTGERK